MQITTAQLAGILSKFDPKKPVCFCSDPKGLEFHRVKGRGGMLQIEFNQCVSRERSGRLTVDYTNAFGPASPILAGDLARDLAQSGDYAQKRVCFGDEALDFIRVEDTGSHINIEFAQRVYRAANGSFVVEEVRAIREEFPPAKESTGGPALRGMRAGIARVKPNDPEKRAGKIKRGK